MVDEISVYFFSDYMLKELKADGLENVHGEEVQVRCVANCC